MLSDELKRLTVAVRYSIRSYIYEYETRLSECILGALSFYEVLCKIVESFFHIFSAQVAQYWRAYHIDSAQYHSIIIIADFSKQIL